MRRAVGWFLLGVLCGLAIAPARGAVVWHRLRDCLAIGIDSLLRIGLPASS